MKISFIYISLSILALTSCGGGDESSVSDPLPVEIIARVDNPDIPAEFAGKVINNTRFYAANSEANLVSVLTTGITDSARVKIGEKFLNINMPGLAVFESSFPGNTNVVIEVDSQPFLQECVFTGGVNTGLIRSDATLQFQLDCFNTNTPAAPFVSKVYSTTIDSINVEWEGAVDRDSAADEISYRIYWSKDKVAVENKATIFKALSAGTLNAFLDNLETGALYYIAIEATDIDGNVSELSDIRELKTIAVPNVLTGTPFHILDKNNIITSGATWTIETLWFTSAPKVGDVLTSDLDPPSELTKITSITQVGADYVIEVGEASLLDVFEQLTVSSNIGYKKPESGTFVSKMALIPASLCRDTHNNTFTLEQLEQISVKPINEFEPRVKNYLTLDKSDLTTPLKGDIEFEGSVTVGVKVAYKLLNNIAGEITCDLTGFPKNVAKKKLIISGFPIYSDIDVDAQLKFTMDAATNVSASTEHVVTSNLSSILEYNPISNKWESTPGKPFAHDDSYDLSYAARADTQIAIIPKAKVTLKRMLSVNFIINTSFDTKLRGRPIDEFDDLALFKNPAELFELNEYKVDANTKLLVSADFTSLGTAFYDYPGTVIHDSKTFSIFDTPKICVNPGSTKDNCSKDKSIQKNSEKRYPLEVFLLDGVRNDSRPASVQWQVTPKSGYFEINDDRRKAVFIPYDDLNYTVFASAHGTLGEAGRKYVSFNINARCQYGLGHKIPAEYEQYFQGDTIGYVFPSNISVVDVKKDTTEICKWTSNDGFPIVGYFYAGERHGDYKFKEQNFNGDGFIEIVENYSSGDIRFFDSTSNYEKRHFEYKIKPDPDSIYNVSVPVLREKYSITGVLEQREVVDISKTTFRTISYYPDGKTKGYEEEYYWGDDSSPFKAGSANPDTLNYTKIYYENGDIQSFINEKDGSGIACFWRYWRITYTFTETEVVEFRESSPQDPPYAYECEPL